MANRVTIQVFAVEWTTWVCSKCGFQNGPNRYCRDCGFARDPRPARILASGVMMIALSVFFTGSGILLTFDDGKTTNFPLTEVGVGALLVAVSIPLVVAAFRMWSVANRIPRKRR